VIIFSRIYPIPFPTTLLSFISPSFQKPFC
jgi:hypothetical protein